MLVSICNDTPAGIVRPRNIKLSIKVHHYITYEENLVLLYKHHIMCGIDVCQVLHQDENKGIIGGK